MAGQVNGVAIIDCFQEFVVGNHTICTRNVLYNIHKVGIPFLYNFCQFAEGHFVARARRIAYNHGDRLGGFPSPC
jgi:hypothetical protein